MGKTAVKRTFFVLSLILGVAAFCAIPFIVGVEKTLQAIASVGWTAVPVYVLNASLVLIGPALGWAILMRSEGLPIPLLDAIKANFMGFPLNFVTPSLYLGGEPVKIVYLAGKHKVAKNRLLATIIVAKFQELVGIFVVALISLSVFVWRTDFFTKENEILLVSAMVVLVALLGLLMAGYIGNYQISVRILNLVAKLGIARRRIARLRTKAREMEHLIHLSFTKRWRSFLLAQLVTMISSFSIFFRPWIYFRFADESFLLGSEHMCLIYVATNFLNMFTIIPGALGILEGGMIGYFSAANLGEHNAVAYSILNRISDIFLLMLGLWFIIHLGLTKVARRVAKGEEQVGDREIEDAIHEEERALRGEEET